MNTHCCQVIKPLTDSQVTTIMEEVEECVSMATDSVSPPLKDLLLTCRLRGTHAHMYMYSTLPHQMCRLKALPRLFWSGAMPRYFFLLACVHGAGQSRVTYT